MGRSLKKGGDQLVNIERKHIRQYLKKSLKSDFEKILYEAKMTADEEEIIRCICCKGMSKVQTALALHISESTVYRVMDDFYDRAVAILTRK